MTVKSVPFWEKIETLRMVGAEGSKIIVNTCSKKFALIIGIREPYRLNRLSDEQSWNFVQETCN